MRCISRVRIWISTGSPLGPITVVCSDWYMLTFGIAMKSLKRPGTGIQREGVTPRALGPEPRRVQRLVQFGLRHRDEVLEASRHGLPERVDHPEGTVAVAHRGGDDPDGRQGVDLVELAALVVHLIPYREEVLGPDADLRVDTKS